MLTGLEEDRRRHLAMLSALGGADRATLTAAAGTDVDPVEVIEGVPLATVDHRGRVTLHALWDEPLEHELDEDVRRRGQVRAADHHLAEGDQVLAFGLYADAGTWDGARAVVRRACAHMYMQVDSETLAEWLDLLLAHAPDAPEVPLLRAARSSMGAQDPMAALPLLEQATAAYRDEGSLEGELLCAVRAFAVGFRVRDADTQTHAILVGVGLAEQGLRAAEPLAGLGRAGFAAFAHDYQGAIDALGSIPVDELSPEWAAFRDWMHGEQLLGLGRPSEALLVFTRPHPSSPAAVLAQLEDGVLQAMFLSGAVEEAVDRSTGARAPGDLPRPGIGDARFAQVRDALAARFCAFLGHELDARRLLEQALVVGPTTDVVTEGRLVVAQAAVHVLAGDEAAAAAALQPYVDAGYLQAMRRSVALPYVLLADERGFWESEPMGPALATALDLARAVVALREDADLTAVAALGPLTAEEVRPSLPVPWATELAVAAHAAGRADGRVLLETLGPAARPFVDGLRSSSCKPVAAAARKLVADIPARPAEVVHVRLLGASALRHGSTPDDGPDWRRKRVRELFALLAMRSPVSREVASDALWPDLDVEAGTNNLRATLSYLLRTLEPAREDKAASYFLAQAEGVLALRGHDRLRVDVWDMEVHARQAAAADRDGLPSRCLASCLEAVAAWGGPFVPDITSAWAEPEQERLRTVFVTAAARAAELQLAGGDPAAALELAHRVLEVSPWSERAHRLVVAGRLEQGDRPGAIEAGRRCTAALDELGVPPDPETSMLLRRLTPG